MPQDSCTSALCADLPLAYDDYWSDAVDCVYRRAFRYDFEQPGFALIRMGRDTCSKRLRRAMVNLKAALSARLERDRGLALKFRAMGRFDQQATTKAHLDGAPDESFLMLGYEPSTVMSRLSLVDYSRYATDHGITPQEFLANYNPMFQKDDGTLLPYTSVIAEFDRSQFQILLINNSRGDPSAPKPALLGVMHKAEMLSPDPAAERVVNSVLLAVEMPSAQDPIPTSEQEAFLKSDHISRSRKP